MSRTPLRIGRVVRARGLRGEVLVRLDNEGSEVLESGRSLLVSPVKGAAAWRVVRSARLLNRGWGVLFEGASDRSDAEALLGAELAVTWDALPSLDEDEFYYEQIRGYEVVLPDGRPLGTVAGLFETSVDILVVQDAATGREHMIPVVDEFVRRIDHAGRRVEVDPPEGLLELC